MQPSNVKSATRALQVLEYFRISQQRRSMSEIAADLGYPQSSTTVLLKTLVGMGYLNYSRRERVYFPTPKVTRLGDWIPRVLFGGGRILDAMHDIHNVTGEGVYLGSSNDIFLQYLKNIESVHALRFHDDEGAIRPITLSAGGWMLLAGMPDDRIDNIVRRANIATPVADRVPIKVMMERIERIRQQGYAYAEDIPYVGGATICTLLPVKVQGQPVVIALGGLADRVRREFDLYLRTVMEAAASVHNPQDFDVPVQIDI